MNFLLRISRTVYFLYILLTFLHFKQKNVGTVFQDFALIPDFSVYENVELPLYFCKNQKRERENAVKQALSLMGLEDLMDRNIKNCKYGAAAKPIEQKHK